MISQQFILKVLRKLGAFLRQLSYIVISSLFCKTHTKIILQYIPNTFVHKQLLNVYRLHHKAN
jgi:hypothetical protein